MEVFEDLSKYSTIFAIVGAVLFVIGMLVRGGNQEKKTGASVIAMIMISVGLVLLIYAISNWVTTGISDWSNYSERML
jgi:amino acid permease